MKTQNNDDVKRSIKQTQILGTAVIVQERVGAGEPVEPARLISVGMEVGHCDASHVTHTHTHTNDPSVHIHGLSIIFTLSHVFGLLEENQTSRLQSHQNCSGSEQKSLLFINRVVIVRPGLNTLMDSRVSSIHLLRLLDCSRKPERPEETHTRH